MVNMQGYDATKYDPNGPIDAIPAGEYTAVITKSEKKAAKTGNGDLLSLELEIVDGQYKGRKVFDNLNIWNSNQQARDIALSTMSAICHAVGVLRPNDTSELHNKPLIVATKHEMYQGEPKTKVKGYKPLNAKKDTSGYSEAIDDKESKEQQQASLAETNADAPWSK